MMTLIVVIIAILAAAAAVGGYVYYRRQAQRKAIADILYDVNPLAVWTYSPAEWQQAVAEEFSWGKADDGPADVRICRSGIYLKSKSREHLIPLADGTKIVTFAEYGGFEGSPLKLRTRWRVTTRDRHGNEEIHYYKDDHRIPVPPREKAAAENVVNYFTKWLDDNPRFYTLMIPDDEPISLFGKDGF